MYRSEITKTTHEKNSPEHTEGSLTVIIGHIKSQKTLSATNRSTDIAVSYHKKKGVSRMNRIRNALVWLALAVMVMVSSACEGIESVIDPSTETPTAIERQEPTATPRRELTAAEIVELMKPSIVRVRVDFPATATEDAERGGGTGVVVELDGKIYILTNSHVVEGASTIRVALSQSQNSRPAWIVATSMCDDLALLEVRDTSGLVPAALGQSSALQPGTEVVALGFPLGDDTLSITGGHISRVAMSLGRFDDLLRTDAPINPGNSGGALVTMYGEVIGINTFKISHEGIEGMGFAIAIDHTRSIVDTLKEGEHRLWHGMNLSEEVVAERAALIVDAVQSGSPADVTGVQPGDWLVQLEGVDVQTTDHVCGILRSRSDGDKLHLRIRRATGNQQVQELRGPMTLGEPDPADELVLHNPVPTPTPEPTATTAPETSFQAIRLEGADLEQAREAYNARLAQSQWILEEVFSSEASKRRWLRARLLHSTYQFAAPREGFGDPWMEQRLGGAYTVQLDVAPQSPGSMVGILYNWQDNHNWSAFMMAGEGVWIAVTMYQGEIIDLQEFDARHAIIGGGNVNQIRVEHFADGSALFWINHEPVGIAASGTLSGGHVGIAGANGTIIVDNLYVWTR
jgi:serine protease Do